jgi:FkbM family methyltransferase
MENPGSRSLQPPREAIALPQDLRIVPITHPSFPDFDLVISVDAQRYDRWVLETRHYSDIALFLNAHLNGAGTLIDLGANIGTVSMAVASMGSRVIAVEMLPQNVRKLSFAQRANAFGQVRIVQAAVSSNDGLLDYGGDEAWGYVVAGAGPVAGSGPKAVALRLDTIIADAALTAPNLLRAPYALKMDIEGHEYEALLGADLFIAEHRPLVVFETVEMGGLNDKTRESKEWMVARGYRLFMLKGRLLLPKAPDSVQEILVADFVAVPPDVPLPAGYEIRDPTHGERLEWLRADAKVSPVHRQHAKRVAEKLVDDDSAFADLVLELAD